MFPGKKDNTQYSFGEVKGMVSKHEVSKPPKKGHSNCTIAEYSNIEGGEKYGERNVKAKHISHRR